MKTKIKEFETFLPVFPGFYGTLYEFNEDNYLYEEGLTYDMITVDYKQYENDIIQSFCDVLPDFCPFIKQITLQEICSPKEYNFRNDSANVIIKIDVLALRKYLNANIESLREYLKGKYTSCSGFISSYDNDVNIWIEETENFTDFTVNGHYLGSLLDFYFLNEHGHDDYFIYDSVMMEIYDHNYITNNVININNSDTFDSNNKYFLAVELIRNNLVSLDFGYLQVLSETIKEKSDLLCMDFAECFANDYMNEIINESKIEFINSDFNDSLKLDMEIINKFNFENHEK